MGGRTDPSYTSRRSHRDWRACPSSRPRDCCSCRPERDYSTRSRPHHNSRPRNSSRSLPPRKYNDKLSTTFEKLGLEAKEAMSGHHSGTTGTGHHTGTTDTTGTGHHTGTTGTGVGSNIGSESHHRQTDSGISGFDNNIERKEASLNRGMDQNRTSTTSLDRDRTGNTGLGSSGRHDVDDTTSQKKPSLLQRLNPRTDADGDGKRGLGD